MLKKLSAIILAAVVVFCFLCMTACGETQPPEKTLASIEVLTYPDRTEYAPGETFDPAGLELIATYSDGSTETVTEGYTFDATAMTDEISFIVITYGGKTVNLHVTVAEPQSAVISALSITALPTKMTYQLGETIDPTGIEVKATYSDGTSADVTGYAVEPSGPLNWNDTALKVSYMEGEKTFTAYGTKKILIEAPDLPSSAREGETELLFSDANNYVLGGGVSKSAWSSDGNTFDRLRCNNDAKKTITFAHDYSALADKSAAAFRAILSIARGGSVMEISVDDGETWQVVTKARAGENTLAADYKFPCSEISGKKATDGTNRNVFYAYWNIGKFMTQETTTAHIRFTYAAPVAGWAGRDVEGSDLMHSVAFYDKVDFTKAGTIVTLSSVAVKTRPAKTVYTEGEVFDPAGLELTAVYSDGSEKTVSAGFTYDTGVLTSGMTAVTVHYGDYTADVPITVNALQAAVTRIAITAPPVKVTYAVGEVFDPAGMIVTAYYEDGSFIAVAGYSYDTGALTKETTSVTITYLGKTAVQEIRVKQAVLTEVDYDISSELLFSDTGNYTLQNNAYTGAKRYFLDDGSDACRLRAGERAGAYIQFEYDFGKEADLSEAGFMIYALDSRLGTVISISVDGDNYVELAKCTPGTDTKVPADWKEQATNIVSTKGDAAKTDGNLKRLYYNVGSYLNASSKLYIRVGFKDPGYTSYPAGTSKEGADIFGSVTFYSRLDLSAVK